MMQKTMLIVTTSAGISTHALTTKKTISIVMKSVAMSIAADMTLLTISMATKCVLGIVCIFIVNRALLDSTVSRLTPVPWMRRTTQILISYVKAVMPANLTLSMIMTKTGYAGTRIRAHLTQPTM
jgi:hypothetical protein